MDSATPALATIREATTDPAAILNAGAALGNPKHLQGGDRVPYAVVPEGYEVHDLPVEDFPKRPKATVKLRDAASFSEYFKTHAAARSTIYGTLEPPRFLAVFDDFFPHARVQPDDEASIEVAGQADWREFRASFEVPVSREWKTWTGAHAKKMSQLEFAEFLLDNIPDIANPAGAEVYEAALRFEASSTGSFVSAARLQDGSHDLVWRADNNAGGTVKLPEHIGIRIPVFENEALADLQARLRYRVNNGALSIWFELVRPHKVLDQAFRDIWQRIEAAAGRKILLGTPE